MKKYFSPGALVTFIIAIVFSVNFLIPQAPAQAQSVSLCETIEALISAGVIAPDRANAARAAAGCLLPPVVPVTELDVDLLSEDIEVEDIDDGYSRAVGFFRFRINSPERDLYVYKAIKDSAVKLLMNGVSVGSPSFINLISASTEGGDTTDYFYVEEGDSRVFTLSYTITPTFGTGYYKAVADRLQLKDWPDYYFDDVESESVFLQGQATSTLLFASEMYLVDTKPTYNAGEIIKYSVKAIASDGTPGDPSRNFNVQAWIFDENTGDTVQVDGEYQSVNASYNDRTRLWDVQMKAPSDTSRTYRVDSAFYCSRPNVLGGCSDKQINKEFRFTIALNGGLGSCPTVLTRDLAVGYSGADVGRLQEFLGVTPTTGYFGSILQAAVKAYQSANGISPADGYVGVLTRGLINWSICNTPVTPKPTISLKYKTLTDRDFSSSGTALVPVGTEIILQWESKNTTSCVASASPAASAWTGMKSVDGLGSIGKVDVGRTYTLTCSGPGGKVTAKVDVRPDGQEPPTTTYDCMASWPTKAYPSNNIKFSGSEGVNSMNYTQNGKQIRDSRFLCSDSKFYACGWELTDSEIARKAQDGQKVGEWTCNLGAKKWSKTPVTPVGENCKASWPSSAYPTNKLDFSGKHNVTGLNYVQNGKEIRDSRFLCVDSKFYACGWELTDSQIAKNVKDGEEAGTWSCDLRTKTWLPIATTSASAEGSGFFATVLSGFGTFVDSISFWK